MEIIEIRINEIIEIFDKLIDDKISREEASNWANKLVSAQDTKMLKYTPAENEKLIWDAIMFLIGVDLKEAPDCYLHNTVDIVTYKEGINKSLGKSQY